MPLTLTFRSPLPICFPHMRRIGQKCLLGAARMIAPIWHIGAQELCCASRQTGITWSLRCQEKSASHDLRIGRRGMTLGYICLGRDEPDHRRLPMPILSTVLCHLLDVPVTHLHGPTADMTTALCQPPPTAGVAPETHLVCWAILPENLASLKNDLTGINTALKQADSRYAQAVQKIDDYYGRIKNDVAKKNYVEQQMFSELVAD